MNRLRRFVAGSMTWVAIAAIWVGAVVMGQVTEADRAEQVALGLAPVEKYAIISNGIDVGRFGRITPSSAELRKELTSLMTHASLQEPAELVGVEPDFHLVRGPVEASVDESRQRLAVWTVAGVE